MALKENRLILIMTKIFPLQEQTPTLLHPVVQPPL